MQIPQPPEFNDLFDINHPEWGSFLKKIDPKFLEILNAAISSQYSLFEKHGKLIFHKGILIISGTIDVNGWEAIRNTANYNIMVMEKCTQGINNKFANINSNTVSIQCSKWKVHLQKIFDFWNDLKEREQATETDMNFSSSPQALQFDHISQSCEIIYEDTLSTQTPLNQMEALSQLDAYFNPTQKNEEHITSKELVLKKSCRLLKWARPFNEFRDHIQKLIESGKVEILDDGSIAFTGDDPLLDIYAWYSYCTSKELIKPKRRNSELILPHSILAKTFKQVKNGVAEDLNPNSMKVIYCAKYRNTNRIDNQKRIFRDIFELQASPKSLIQRKDPT